MVLLNFSSTEIPRWPTAVQGFYYFPDFGHKSESKSALINSTVFLELSPIAFYLSPLIYKEVEQVFF